MNDDIELYKELYTKTMYYTTIQYMCVAQLNVLW